MPEVMRVSYDEAATTALRGPEPVLDAAAQAVLEREVARARQAGHAEGERAGRQAAAAEAARAADAVGAAAAQVRDELVAQRREASRASLALARAVAEAVIGATPPAEADAIVDRVSDALDLLDDEPLTVHLHPDDHAVVAAHPPAGVELAEDPSLQPGEARISARCAGAELTRQALLEAAMGVLGEAAA